MMYFFFQSCLLFYFVINVCWSGNWTPIIHYILLLGPDMSKKKEEEEGENESTLNEIGAINSLII